jgi:DNA repair protein RecO (recombination protein O)
MSRERTFRTEAIVMRRTDFGEADRLLTLFSREKGKIKAVAKGARKPQSRKTGHVELFTRATLFVAVGRDLGIITQAETVEAHAALRQDLVRATYAAYFVELLDRFVGEEDPHAGIYQLLSDALVWLTEMEMTELPLAARYYELRLLSLTGFQPRRFHCVACNSPIQEQDQFFSAELGGLLCPDCYEADRNGKPITAVAVKVLRYLQSRSWDTVKVLRLKRPLHTELENLMHHTLTYILERNLKSVDFLYRLRREAALLLPDTSPKQ